MKKVLAVALTMAMVISLFGCGGQEASKNDVEFLTVSEYWYHYDEVTGENEKMSFGEDFTFYWGCQCGEPIGNSDCYELYDYDKETGIIRLYNDYDDVSMEIKVHDYSDYHLLLEIEGEIKNFTYVDTYIEMGMGLDELEEYIAGYSGEYAVIEGSPKNVVLTHFDYDGDVEYPGNVFKTYDFAEDVEFYFFEGFTHIKDGEVIQHDVDHGELTVKDAVSRMESGSAIVWFDKELKITKMMFYGATRFEE